MTERQKLIKILYFHVKYLENTYLKMKMDVSYQTDIRFLKILSKKFKNTQKILEYMRKGHEYYYVEKLIITGKMINISLFGRDTWRKNENSMFEVGIFHKQYKLYEDRIIREIKLRRILKN